MPSVKELTQEQNVFCLLVVTTAVNVARMRKEEFESSISAPGGPK